MASVRPRRQEHISEGGQPCSNQTLLRRLESYQARSEQRYPDQQIGERKFPVTLRAMNADLETDFRDQQDKLTVLQDSRDTLENGTQAAADLDNKIAETKGLILSYQALKYYE